MPDRGIYPINPDSRGKSKGQDDPDEVPLSWLISISILVGLVAMGVLAWVWSSDWRWAVSGFVGGFFGAIANDLIGRVKKHRDERDGTK